MVTKEQAMTAKRFHHVTIKNADGTPLRVRANGKCKTWKRDSARFELPIKHGLYAYSYIAQDNAHEWEVAP